MKRLYFIVLLLVALALCFSVASFAAEDPAITSVDSYDEAGGTAETETDYQTVFTRIWEFVETYQDRIIDVVGFVVLLLWSFVSAIKQRKKNAEISKGVTGILGTTSSVENSQSGVVRVVNELVVAYNELKEATEKTAALESDRIKLLGAVSVQNATILEMLSTVYVNSKNLPQGVKDLIYLKYAKCLSALENDEKLKACVDVVRDITNEDEQKTEV